MRYFALDTETTGVNPSIDRIIDLCIIEVDDDAVNQGFLKRRFNPGIPIPPEATRVHGIRDTDVAGSPLFSDAAKRIQRLLGAHDAVILAYNGRRFDVPLIHAELVRAGQPGLDPNIPIIDPYLIFQKQLPRSLSGAMRYYIGHVHMGAHNAHSDVLGMLDVVRVQRKFEALEPRPLMELVHQDPFRRLDHFGFLILDELGIARFNFGKHRGQPVSQHRQYAGWMLANDFPDAVKQALRKVLVTEGTS